MRVCHRRWATEYARSATDTTNNRPSSTNSPALFIRLFVPSKGGGSERGDRVRTDASSRCCYRKEGTGERALTWTSPLKPRCPSHGRTTRPKVFGGGVIGIGATVACSSPSALCARALRVRVVCERSAVDSREHPPPLSSFPVCSLSGRILSWSVRGFPPSLKWSRKLSAMNHFRRVPLRLPGLKSRLR